MSNYVWNKVFCTKEMMEKYFIDPDPFGKKETLEKSYISFNKLYNMKSIYEYADKVDVPISYGLGTSWRETENGLYELMFCTRWKYPIKAITKSIELSHDTVWMAFEENNIYVSRFYWDNGVKQDVLLIENEYYSWYDENMEYVDSLKEPDDGVWHFLPYTTEKWRNWESTDGFARYFDVDAIDVDYPFRQQ